MNFDRPDYVPAEQLEWYLSRNSLTLGSSEGSNTMVIEPREEALNSLRDILAAAGPDEAQLQDLRAAAKKVLAEEPHERGWQVGTEATAYGTLSHVYTPDLMAGHVAHRQIATNMSDTNAEYLASLHPARFLSILDQLDRLEDTASQAVADQEAAQLQLDTVRELHKPDGASLGSTSTGYGMIDQCCAQCGTKGEYGEEWPCETARAVYSETEIQNLLTGATNV